MKPIPQRTYTRNGTIFKTVEGVRYKSGKIMKYRMEFSIELPVPDIYNYIESELDFFITELNLHSGKDYLLRHIRFGQTTEAFINEEIICIATFERVKP